MGWFQWYLWQSEIDYPRQTLQINNTCDLLAGGEGMEQVYLSSRSKNQFLANREMCLDLA